MQGWKVAEAVSVGRRRMKGAVWRSIHTHEGGGEKRRIIPSRRIGGPWVNVEGEVKGEISQVRLITTHSRVEDVKEGAE